MRQAHPREAPAPTLIKNRERLAKANPLAPVMTLNSANIVGLLLSQESGKRLAAVMRPCEARALVELAKQGQVRLADLVTVSIDCLGSHDEVDYEMRTDLWGDDVPTRESLRWSRQGQIAPYRFRQAGLGPLIGKRSWGGVVGISSRGPLIDGGQVYVPMQATNDPEGRWIIEGHGVDPDIEVDNLPPAVVAGGDPQLERAVAEVLRRMEENPLKLPDRPPDPIKTK